ncbi:MAG: Na(+)/H(+) antiporter subunit B [Planctomycetota bacterium]|nr:Na(+)/H(+) antiporter subunit B [Planctomycetota bacterium]
MSSVTGRVVRRCFALMVLMLVGGIGWTILSLPTEWNGLSDHVAARLDESGARNPVTAVLLNFRGYDTLLEIGVLLLAALAVRSVAADRNQTDTSIVEPPGLVLMGLLRLVAPLIVLVAGYLLWVGGHAPGGAFQAGAVLASLVVLVLLCDPRLLPRIPNWLERLLLSLGLFVFIGVGLSVMAFHGALLQYPPGQAKWLILVVEAACTLSIAAVLAALFAGGRIASLDGLESRTQKEEGP